MLRGFGWFILHGLHGGVVCSVLCNTVCVSPEHHQQQQKQLFLPQTLQPLHSAPMDCIPFIYFSLLFSPSFVFLCQTAFLCFTPLSLSPPPGCGCGLIRKCVAQNRQSITLPKPTTSTHALADTQTHTHPPPHSPLPHFPPLFIIHTDTFKLWCVFFQVISSISHLPLLSFLSFTSPCPSNPLLLLLLFLHLLLRLPPPTPPPSRLHPLIYPWQSCLFCFYRLSSW